MEAAGTSLRRPTAGLNEVFEDEAEASSLVVLSRGVGFQATNHHTEDVGGSGSVLSPLYLGELLFNFAFPLVLKLSYFIGTCFLFLQGA